MEIRGGGGGGGYAAALLIADRSDLRPLHHPRSWLHGATASPLFMMLSVWPRNKRAAACSVIREDWNQLLTLTIQHGAGLLVLFKCDGCKIKYKKKGYCMFLLSTALAAPCLLIFHSVTGQRSKQQTIVHHGVIEKQRRSKCSWQADSSISMETGHRYKYDLFRFLAKL